MYPYFIMVGVPAVLALILNHLKLKTSKANRFIVDVFFFIWLILLILRSEEVGSDLLVYKYHFFNFSDLSYIEIFKQIIAGQNEAGYALIAKTVSLFTVDFHVVMAACALISVIPIWKMYRNEGSHGFLVIALFINIAPFVMYFSGLRQAMAMAFVVPCYRYCKEKKFFKYLFMILLAYLFHRSSLILLLMYPVYHLRLKKQLHILYILPLILTVYIFNVPIFRFLLMIMEGGYAEEYIGGIQPTGAYAVLLLLAVLLVYTFLIADQDKLDSDTVGLRNLMILCVFLQTFSGVHTIAMRMNYYFLLFVPLLISKSIEAGKDKFKPLIRLSMICMIVFFVIYYFYYAYTDTDILNVYPYDSFIKDIRSRY